MNIKSLSTDYKKALIFTLVLTAIYELILSIQGFDLCDEGSALTVYQQIFKCPSSVEYQFVYYLGGVVGGVWNILFGFGGILSFRILTIFALIIIIYFTSKTLKGFINPLMIPVAASMVLLMETSGILVFFHNHLTAVLAALTAYFLLRGLNLNRPWYIFTAALIGGINIFTRIPNFLLLALGLLLFIDYFYRKDKRLLGRNILFSIAGLITGIAAVFLFMCLVGHEKIFVQNVFENLLSKGTSSDSPHNFRKLVYIYIENYQMIFMYLSIFIFSIAFFPFIYRYHKYKWEKGIVIILFSFVIIAFSLFAFHAEKYYAIILFPIILSCYIDRKNKSIVLLNAASLITLLFMPLGSDVGVRNMGAFSTWLATFTSVAHVYRFIRYEMQKGNNSYRLFFVAFYFWYCVYGIYVVSRNGFYDRGPRWEKLYRADNDKFTVFTSKAKAEAMDVLLSELGKYVHKDDYLFCYESIPMVHYLTETKPYIGNPFVWVYDSNNFVRHLEKSEKTIPLPVVVRQKCQPIGGYWTTPAPVIEHDNYLYSYFYKDKNIKSLEKFLSDNQYKIVWENDLFQIYLPPNISSK